MKSIALIFLLLAANNCFSQPISYQEKRKEVDNWIFLISVALDVYRAEHGRFPNEQEGISVLAWKSPDLRQAYPKGPPADPWGNSYQYSLNPCVRTYSFGADGKAGGSGENQDVYGKCRAGS